MMKPTNVTPLDDTANAQDLLDLLALNEVEKLDEFEKLLKSCNLRTVGAIRLFSSSLPLLVEQMYDMETVLGSLQCKGFLAIVMVISFMVIHESQSMHSNH